MKIISVLAAMALFVFVGPGSVLAEQGTSGTTIITVTITPEQLAALRGGPGKGPAVTPNGSTTVSDATVVTDTPGNDGHTLIRTIVTL